MLKRALSFMVALALVILMAPDAQAYRIYTRVFSANNTTYQREASFDNQGAAWIADANQADADWGNWFNFINGNSANRLRTQAWGVNGLLGLTTPFLTVGPYASGFFIDINRDIVWHTGPGPVPVNRYSLRTVLRHEMGHALGLVHSGNAGTLMNDFLDDEEERFVDADAQNGANFLYNPGAGAPIPEGPFVTASAGPYDDLDSYVGYKGPAWTASSPWPRAYNQTIVYSNGNQTGNWLWFNGSRITRRFTMAGNRGNRTVYIDGVEKDTISDYAPQVRWQAQRTWSVSNGVHFLEVRGHGAGSYTDLDAFIVNISYQGAGTYDNYYSSPFTYIGSGWLHSASFPPAYSGSLSWSGTAEDAVSFTFYGNKVIYKYTKADNRGKAAITIDGINYGLLDLYSGSIVWQATTEYNLNTGIHTINVSVSGERNGSSNGYFVDVDSFQAVQ